ncbi:unnamed protein product [Vitrella brassicaformis CCMP3155]|uniref:Uncharacterized protein n=2 Tax=Vitrella brassicaformis TaxID=1169539 RepID=A0A0G4FNT9_VITBC|nr:unnamed protein product [Vitrella brassicaformis CCMP3155]|eukprot:CEM15894.1 unnamed protein product [Vitrella brassicaformis CCMP3155]
MRSSLASPALAALLLVISPALLLCAPAPALTRYLQDDTDKAPKGAVKPGNDENKQQQPPKLGDHKANDNGKKEGPKGAVPKQDKKPDDNKKQLQPPAGKQPPKPDGKEETRPVHGPGVCDTTKGNCGPRQTPIKGKGKGNPGKGTGKGKGKGNKSPPKDAPKEQPKGDAGDKQKTA